MIGCIPTDNGHLYIGHGVANTWTSIKIKEGEMAAIKERNYPGGASHPFPFSYHRYDVRKDRREEYG